MEEILSTLQDRECLSRSKLPTPYLNSVFGKKRNGVAFKPPRRDLERTIGPIGLVLYARASTP
jgi:hypothetical protein